MVFSGSDLDLVASFHGSLSKDMKVNTKRQLPKVLILNGSADPFVTKEQIDHVKKILSKASVNYQFFNYAGAQHAFTNKMADSYGKEFNLPLAYDEEADEESWSTFLTEFEAL